MIQRLEMRRDSREASQISLEASYKPSDEPEAVPVSIEGVCVGPRMNTTARVVSAFFRWAETCDTVGDTS
jgi:hypothetical protein